MKEVINKMIEHPIRTALIIGGFTSGVVSIIHAIKDVKAIATKNN